ncbi:MAG: hypothetical protein ACKPA7_10640 [Sphaerospermopsis kisseleviana]
MESLDATRPFNCSVFFDSEYFEDVLKIKLNALAREEKSREFGFRAKNILAEYGSLVHYCSIGWMNNSRSYTDNKLGIVIDVPEVHFCIKDDLDGVFIEKYDSLKHGNSVCTITKEKFSEFSNIEAREDGWWFFGEMWKI